MYDYLTNNTHLIDRHLEGVFSPAYTNEASSVLHLPTGTPNENFAITLNLDAAGSGSDNVKAQRSLDNGKTWTDYQTYSVPQKNVSIPVKAYERWRLAMVGQPTRTILYSLRAPRGRG